MNSRIQFLLHDFLKDKIEHSVSLLPGYLVIIWTGSAIDYSVRRIPKPVEQPTWDAFGPVAV
jgi:hypothetical protein